jgi:hypothetical protein
MKYVFILVAALFAIVNAQQHDTSSSAAAPSITAASGADTASDKGVFGVLKADSAKADNGRGDSARTCKEEKPAMELGGYITLDYDAKADSLESGKMFLRWVQLGANVNISEEVIGSVVILVAKKLDSLTIYQADASYMPAGTPWQFLFGQQIFNHGLLTTRLISDPLIINDAMLIYPGLTAIYSAENFKPSLAFAVLDYQDSSYTASKSNYAAILGLDFSLPSESLIRLSALLSQELSDIDLALTYTMWKLAIDAEIYSQFKGVYDAKMSGYYAGIRYDAADRVHFALRNDGLSSNAFKEMEMRYAGGVVIDIRDGVFLAVELSHVKPYSEPAYQQIQVQIGLQQKLALPGFQRKTLTRE